MPSLEPSMKLSKVSKYVTCTDHCDCLGTHLISGAGYVMGCRNDNKYDMYGEPYLNTSLVKYYTEICKNNGRCGFGSVLMGGDHFRTLDSCHSSHLPDENTKGSCPKYCANYLSEFCPNEVQSISNCKFLCPK